MAKIGGSLYCIVLYCIYLASVLSQLVTMDLSRIIQLKYILIKINSSLNKLAITTN